MEDDFPYKAEYAKSGRASCKKCKDAISQDSLRIAVMVQSPTFDGKMPRWHHMRCFFLVQKPKSVQDIEKYDSLRWEDQEKIKEKIAAGGTGTAQKSKGKKGAAKGGNLDFNIEVSKSSRATCRACEEKIVKDEIRASKKDYEGDKAKRFGPIPMWHHLDCFVEKRVDLEWFNGGEDLPGFNTLSGDNKKLVREKLKKIEVKRKAEEDSVDGAPSKKPKIDESKMEKQNKKMFYFRDNLNRILKKAEMADMLEYNGYTIPSGESRILDLLADLMTFGVCVQCNVCNNGSFYFQSGLGYKCRGDLTEWTKCTNVVDEPKRKPFEVPEELTEEYSFLEKYKYKNYGPRIIIKREIKNGNGTMNEKAEKKALPFPGMTFCFKADGFTKSQKEMEIRIMRLGGKVDTKVNKNTTALITTKSFLDSEHPILDNAKKHGVQCVPEDFLDEIQVEGVVLMIEKKNMAPWGKAPSERIKSTKSSSKKNGSGSSAFKDIPYKLQVKLKGGAAVDPDSGLEESCHVYQRSGKNYNSVLGLVDLVRGTNSYYKLQLLESNAKSRWYVFRSWGRIGTEIGGQKLEDMEDLTDAMQHFKSLYEDKTGNRFDAKEFQKIPHKLYPLDIDYGQDKEEMKKLSVTDSKSKLPIALQKFIALICDIDTMKNTMVEFEIDLKKMPLGKLSAKQLETAYNILSLALELIADVKVKTETPLTEEEIKEKQFSVKAKLLDCSNRFYTLIPHDFGMNNPPLLDNEEMVKSKIDMVDNLREIEVAYSVLKSEDKDTKGMDPIDKHYKKLKTKMSVLEKDSEEFKMIKEYVKNTHASTHSHYKLEVEEVFAIERDGEKKRFKPFKKLPNHQLLWHGSRITNYVGILSQGLRIAPPEAPVTGYMFGKGVYFADMVSKSANYCSTSKSNNTGMLMLCDVALGEMYERKDAEYVEKLPMGKHSTKGIGMTFPDPSKTKILEDGLQVPLGKPVKSDVKHSSLLYNEFVVYDVGQINAKYLIQTNFKYAY